MADRLRTLIIVRRSRPFYKQVHEASDHFDSKSEGHSRAIQLEWQFSHDLGDFREHYASDLRHLLKPAALVIALVVFAVILWGFVVAVAAALVNARPKLIDIQSLSCS
jgi:hypothetical protein